MFWQPILVIFLGCTLAGKTLTSAVSFSRPPQSRQQRGDIADGEDLIQALKFLERYEEDQGSMVGDDYPRYGDNEIFVPYGQGYPQYFDQGNDLPPPMFRSQDYIMPEMSYVDPYEEEEILLRGQADELPVQSMHRNSIGQQIERRVEFEQLMDHLIQDAIIEEALQDDARETAELLREDLTEEEDSSYNVELETDYYSSIPPEDSLALVGDEDYDYSASSDVLWQNLTDGEEIQIGELTSEGDLMDMANSGIDKDLLETVIQQITQDTVKQKLLDETNSNNIEEEIPDEGQFEIELDTFVNRIMSELADGSEDLANKLLGEIDEEREELEAEISQEESDSLSSFVELNEAQSDPGVVFSNGWGSFALDDEGSDLGESEESCPALSYILEDCSVVDEFPGLGDGGYKQVFEIPCNRHQLCYLCSGTYDIPKGLCDDVYKMELMSICNHDPECEFRSKYFWLSAVASRTPFATFLPVCREPCVIELFISN